MDPVTTGSAALDVFIAILGAMGFRKGAQTAYRYWGNGMTHRTEPITKEEMKDELGPIKDHQEKVLEELKEQSKEMRSHNGWLKGYLERGN